MECVQEIEKTKIVSVRQLQFVLLNIKFFSRKTKKSKAESSKNVGSTTNGVDDDLEAALLNKDIKNRQKCAICYSGLFDDTPSTSEFSTPSQSGFLSPINGHRGINEIAPFRASTLRDETESATNLENSNDGREIAVVVELNGCPVI